MTGAVAQWMRAAVAQLQAAGVPGPQRDAQLILADLLSVPPHLLAPPHDHPHLSARLADMPDAQAGFAARIAQRAAGMPVSKILGRRAFWTSEFRVTADVLDPRPETETLIAAALRHPFNRLLDLGTGTGCIAISLCLENPAATALASDLSGPALAVAQHNIDAAGLSDRIALVQSDWFAAIAGRFDLIVSNPPYIAADEMPGLSREVRDHDPHMALTDGADGLSAYRAICADAVHHLTPGGALLVEIGPTQGAAVAALFMSAGLADVSVLPDLDGRDRVVRGILPAN